MNVDFILYTLTWALFLVLPFIFSFHLPHSHSLPLHLPRSLRLSCSFSAICERAARCPRHINTQWPSQGLQQRAQVPFSVSLTDFYTSPSLPHFPFSLSYVSPSESNCTFFKFYTSGENAVIFKKTTQKSKFFLYTLPSFSLLSMCDPHLCSLVYSFSLLPHCFSHWKSVMCFCLLPLLHVSPSLHLPYMHKNLPFLSSFLVQFLFQFTLFLNVPTKYTICPKISLITGLSRAVKVIVNQKMKLLS